MSIIANRTVCLFHAYFLFCGLSALDLNVFLFNCCDTSRVV